MTEISREAATGEIHATLNLCNFCTRKIGFSFIDKLPSTVFDRLKANIWLLISALILFLKLSGEISYVTTQLLKSTSVVDFVAGMHIVGYDTMSNYFTF